MTLSPDDLEQVRACEERLINLWPAPVTMMMDGWAIRMAHGYSARANSASPLIAGATCDTLFIERIEALYRAENLAPCFRITPLAAPAVLPRLIERGYHLKDRAFGMIAPLAAQSTSATDAAVQFDAKPTRAWVEAISALQEPSKRSPEHFLSIVGAIRMPAVFATLSHDTKPVGYGYCGLDRGLAEIGSIMIDPAHRGQGHGRRLMQALMRFAAEAGGKSVFLQVAETNTAARQLYRTTEFRELYSYDTMVKTELKS